MVTTTSTRILTLGPLSIALSWTRKLGMDTIEANRYGEQARYDEARIAAGVPNLPMTDFEARYGRAPRTDFERQYGKPAIPSWD